MIKQLIKGLYYSFLNPFYRKLKGEVTEEIHAVANEKIEQLTHEVLRLTQELERVKKQGIDQQNRLSQMISEEFIKMYEEIEDIKSDRTEVKLNVTLVNELVKIHQTLETLKYQNTNGREP